MNTTVKKKNGKKIRKFNMNKNKAMIIPDQIYQSNKLTIILKY